MHEGCGNVVTLKDNMEDLHKGYPKDYPNVAPFLPQSYPNLTLMCVQQEKRLQAQKLAAFIYNKV